jgi:enoyl-CoA hydratase/carnithine racemase
LLEEEKTIAATMETLNIHDDSGIRRVEMNRPEALNAFSSLLMDELAQTFLDARDDAAVRVLVLTGAGRAFSAGADLQEMGQPAQRQSIHGFPGLLEAILEFPKPFIVAINGVGAGIGATIAGLADLVYMSEKARLRAPFSALGLTAEAASTLTFPLLMGRQRANWFLLSAEWMSAQECVDAGLALEVLPAEQLLPRVTEQAAKLARLPLASLATTKRLLLDPIREQLRAAIQAENKALAELVGQDANREALRAFAEKREPDFSGM